MPSTEDKIITPEINQNPQLQAYYASLESRLGYRLFLGGTRHFGYYDSEHSNPLRINSSLRRMENELRHALNLPERAVVLDAGCGYGHVALQLAKTGNFNIEAIDVVQRHVSRATANIKRAGLASQIHVQHGDYHHLDSLFPSDQFDGVYTMETLVHATDPSAVLLQFFRVLNPGGHIAMHEYDHTYDPSTSSNENDPQGRKAMSQINQYAAMPANQTFRPGVLEKMMREAGFVDVQVRDLSRHVWPMLWLFYIIAWMPFQVFRVLGIERFFVNTVTGYWSWKRREAWRYVQVVGRKPDV